MPVELTYPGVYVQELPNPVRPIVGVPTSVAAFVGPAPRGPLADPVELQSWGDYVRTFGDLDPAVPMSCAVYLFYLNGGSTALVVRMADGGPDGALEGDLTTDAAGKKAPIKLDAGSPGAWAGRLTAEVDKTNLLDPDTTFNLTIRDRGTGAVESYAGASVDAATDTYLPTLLTRSQLVTADPDGEYEAPAVPGIYGFAVEPGAAPAQASLSDDIVLEACSPGAWGTDLVATVANADAKQKSFELTITDAGTGAIEQYTLALPPKDPKDFPPGSALVRAAEANKYEKLPADKPKIQFKLPAATKNGDKPAAQDGARPSVGEEGAKTGIYALVKADIFNILCLPTDPGQRYPKDELAKAADFCAKQRAMLIVDPPTSWGNTTPLTFEAVTADPPLFPRRENAAVYYPDLVMTNKHGARFKVGPCGAVAGVWAATDTQRGVWKAPAGTAATIGGITDLAAHVDDGESGVLNPIAVNTLRPLPLVGPVSWGARTTVGIDQLPNQWKYIPIRRTALFIEESLRRGTQWVVFEPNDEPLWASIRLNVTAFMNSLFRQGAFQGSTPAEAYVVKCDKDNNPQDQIDIGIVNILVGFAPLKPAEFVVISIQQQAGQA